MAPYIRTHFTQNVQSAFTRGHREEVQHTKTSKLVCDGNGELVRGSRRRPQGTFIEMGTEESSSVIYIMESLPFCQS